MVNPASFSQHYHAETQHTSPGDRPPALRDRHIVHPGPEQFRRLPLWHVWCFALGRCRLWSGVKCLKRETASQSCA